MKYYYFITLIIILIPYYNFGQVTDKGKPVFNYSQKNEIPLIILPEVDMKKLQREDKEHSKSNLKSLRFAELIEVDINIASEGVWKKNLKGDKVLYFSIKSPGAYSLSVLFDHFRLPKGAKLFIYSSDQKHVRGSFTYKNNKWNNILPIAPVQGDEIIIEYHEPFNVDFKGEMHISTIAHDYKNIFNYLSKSTKGFGDSGNCNVNINCDDNEMWQLLKHSVCKITYNGWLCSGALINNTKQDGNPFFLTANHCISDAFDASAAVFYFNYESDTCVNYDGRKDQTISGSVIIATPPSSTIDFSLLELSVNPPPEYQPYFAGWNRDIADPTSVTSIHHPQGDIKKITKSYDGAVTGDYGGGFNEFTHWWIDEWDDGTTEGGSSGSPLFDQDGKIIGDLTGGEASCTYNFNDYYQQFHHSWNSFADTNYNLKPWLDPNDDGMISLSGYLPYDTIPSNLKVSLSDTIIQLFWNDVVDTSKIQFYYIHRDSVKIDSVETSYYVDTNAFSNILYKYFVTASNIIPTKYESQTSNVVYVRTMDVLNLPFVEKFEDQFSIPNNWYEERTVDTVGWEFKTGGFAGVVDTAFEGNVNAYFFGKNNESSKLVFPRFDLSTYDNVKLSFYLHMQGNVDSLHNLKILYKGSDSLNWKSIRAFETGFEEWEKKEISLFNLTSNYQIAFEGIGLGGYGICIDSVSIIEDNKFIETHFNTNKDTICINDSIEFTTAIDTSNDFYWDFGTTADPNNAIGPGPHWVKYSNAGIKSVQLIVNDTYVKNEFDAVIVYVVPAIPNFSNIGNELISSSENGNQWYFNGDSIDGAINNTYIIEEDGNYFVEVKNNFNCTSVSESQYMMVSDFVDISIDDVKNNEIKIYPNPSNGNFIIQIESVNIEKQLIYEIVDIAGRIIQTGIINSFEKNKNIEILEPNEGIYFIKIYSSKEYFTSKILIKK
ncbi:MAG: T9SS type A sorting domain-containing protein [Bacteroidales bacterium]|jgi:hypothetical protein|nr:T9SS type A sorting domain-containing protein [Bacteroidales bacterium]